MSEKNPVAESKKKGSFRVFRGGGWNLDAGFAGVAYRGGNFPGRRYVVRGFRLARTKK